MRDDSFFAQRDAGIEWLNVHPLNLCDDDDWAIVQIARNWREGLLPGPGGVMDQPAWIVAAVEIVLGTWGRMQAKRDERERERWKR